MYYLRCRITIREIKILADWILKNFEIKMKREKQKCRKSIMVKPSTRHRSYPRAQLSIAPFSFFPLRYDQIPRAQLEDTRHYLSPVCSCLRNRTNLSSVSNGTRTKSARIPPRPPSSPSSLCPHYRSRESNDITSAFVSSVARWFLEFSYKRIQRAELLFYIPPRNVSFFEIVVLPPWFGREDGQRSWA